MVSTSLPTAPRGNRGWRYKMSKYNVSAVRIENGVISTDFYATTDSQKAFLADKSIIEVFPVAGWKFGEIHLTHGNQENGGGWAFFK